MRLASVYEWIHSHISFFRTHITFSISRGIYIPLSLVHNTRRMNTLWTRTRYLSNYSLPNNQHGHSDWMYMLDDDIYMGWNRRSCCMLAIGGRSAPRSLPPQAERKVSFACASTLSPVKNFFFTCFTHRQSIEFRPSKNLPKLLPHPRVMYRVHVL